MYKELINLVVLFSFFSVSGIKAQSIGETITDVDGNTYKTIKIGDQLWMAENLKTTKFNDGTKIPLVTDNAAWDKLKKPGFCWYNNKADNKDTYGGIYNWYVVKTAKVCPSGWHVPTDDEWKKLEMAVGMSKATTDSTGKRGSNEGSKLAGNAELWTDGTLTSNPSFGSSGFHLVAGGFRGGNGRFYEIDRIGNWWTTTEYNNDNSWYRGIYFYGKVITRYGLDKRSGISIRCVKD